MSKLKLLGAVALLSAAFATPLMAQPATQEPGVIGYNYPNSNYLLGGYGVSTPYNTGRYPRMPWGGYVVYGGPPVAVYPPAVGFGVGPVGIGVGPGYGYGYGGYGAYGAYSAYGYVPY
jgi:hypothetical protein